MKCFYFTFLPSRQEYCGIALQIVLILQGLNESEEELLEGFIKYSPPASH